MAEKFEPKSVVIERSDRLELENIELKLMSMAQQINGMKAEGDKLYAQHQKLTREVERKYRIDLKKSMIQPDGTVAPRPKLPPGMLPPEMLKNSRG
jgi:hypothetical protein